MKYTDEKLAIFPQIVEQTISVFGIDPLSKSRKVEAIKAKVAFTNILFECGWTKAQISKQMHVTHGAVIHRLGMHQEFMFTDVDYKRHYQQLQECSQSTPSQERPKVVVMGLSGHALHKAIQHIHYDHHMLLMVDDMDQMLDQLPPPVPFPIQAMELQEMQPQVIDDVRKDVRSHYMNMKRKRGKR